MAIEAEISTYQNNIHQKDIVLDANTLHYSPAVANGAQEFWASRKQIEAHPIHPAKLAVYLNNPVKVNASYTAPNNN